MPRTSDASVQGSIGEWLRARTPRPPDALMARLESALGEALSDDASLAPERCLTASEQLVSDILRGECTSRDSALDLLTADALVTYAFEAASDEPSRIHERASAAMTRLAALAG